MTVRRIGAMFVVLVGLCACETIYVPWFGGKIERVGLTERAQCEATDHSRTSCISDCAKRYYPGDAQGRCNERCDAAFRSCSVGPDRIDPISRAGRAY